MKLYFFVKTFLVLLTTMFVLDTTVAAMAFSQPIKIGEIMIDTAGVFGNGYLIKGAIENRGRERKIFFRGVERKSYEKGVAKFGNDENDVLYFHYDLLNNKYREMFGARDLTNTISLQMGEGNHIFLVKTDGGIVLYPIYYGYGTVTYYVILGKRDDGTFVKYIDTEDIQTRYFGAKNNYINFYNLSCKENEIVIPYEVSYIIENHPLTKYNRKKGVFRFKWDDKAQWFGVEQVVY